jgi:hypothetical protein
VTLARNTTDALPLVAANTAVYLRVRDGGVINFIGFLVVVSSGNVSVAAYRNTGLGRAAVPGARLATSGSVACPAIGYATLALDVPAALRPGDWLAISANNATATFKTLLAAQGDSDLGLGRMLRQGTAHPCPSTAAPSAAVLGSSFALVGIR